MGIEKRRINTQMPRRTKVQPSTLLASEWDIAGGSPPSGLRTPADKMRPASTNDHPSTNVSSASPAKPPENPRK
ncbi:MAG: hypothetical protein NTNFB01_33760 [Nitrospira sp.]